MLIFGAGVDVNRARFSIGILFDSNDLRLREQSVPSKHARMKNTLRITQICDRIERNIRHRLAEHHVKDEQIIHRSPLVTH